MQQSITLMLRIGCILLSLLFSVTGVAFADDYDDALSALSDGDYREAYRGFKRLARRDHIEAQFQLGVLYLYGKGVGRDSDTGIEWLRQAAESGSYLAANELGQIYLSGKDVTRDEAEAIKWLELATEIAEQHEGEAEDGCE
ncbi:MAG: sel1 repeat family protein [Candidatus Thiodiazotropha sp. (ex Epidulcina cf. delphinae)]|nr:sel1 repeat family protein [Candidatus Thiodiazotropha sp. (ex Epidulcina cf. delphinae)]